MSSLLEAQAYMLWTSSQAARNDHAILADRGRSNISIMCLRSDPRIQCRARSLVASIEMQERDRFAPNFAEWFRERAVSQQPTGPGDAA
jgi:hypothetical protein